VSVRRKTQGLVRHPIRAMQSSIKQTRPVLQVTVRAALRAKRELPSLRMETQLRQNFSSEKTGSTTRTERRSAGLLSLQGMCGRSLAMGIHAKDGPNSRCSMGTMFKTLALLLSFLLLVGRTHSATPQVAIAKVIFDTDIGDDIDDAYALGFLLRSPEVQVLGVTTAFEDTHLRARLATRFLNSAGRADVSVYEGPKTPGKPHFTQSTWAEGSPDRSYPDAIDFILKRIRSNPGQVTLVAVAPLTNVGALIAKDPKTFGKLKRVVLMGGSVAHGYGAKEQPDAEWNIVNDISAAKALFGSGVPLYMMPLDSTQIQLDLTRQAEVFGKGTGMTKALEELTAEWSAATHHRSPTLFDAVAAAYAVKPEVCPATPMRIEVDANGFTRKVEGAANANVCLRSNAGQFFDIFMQRSF
jgi:purine nucleosidase